MSDATRITTRWPCLRFYQLFTGSPTCPLNTSSVCLRMVCGWLISPSGGHYGQCQWGVLKMCGSLCRLSGAGAQKRYDGFSNRDQSEPNGGGCDVHRCNGCLFCGCAKGQHTVGGPRTAQRPKRWLHVSACGAYLCILQGCSLFWNIAILGLVLFYRFETESSLWGPFLSAVNGEQARQSDRRYWSLSSNGNALTEGGHLLHTSHFVFSVGRSHFSLLSFRCQ